MGLNSSILNRIMVCKEKAERVRLWSLYYSFDPTWFMHK